MTVQLKRNDTKDTISYTITNLDGSVVNLTGAAVKFVMGKGNALITNAAAAIVNAATGEVSYTLTEADTLVSGTFNAEFEVTFSDGKVKTYPSNGYIQVKIEANIDTDKSTHVEDNIALRVSDIELFKTEVNTKVDQAVEAVAGAAEAAESANTAATNATTQAAFAKTQGDYAKAEADRLAGTNVSTLDNKIGTLTSLTTTNKSSIVNAVNELSTSVAQIAKEVSFDYWTPPVQPNTWAGTTMLGDEFLATFYDKYVGTSADYSVTKTNLGKDQSGIYDIHKYVFEPKNYTRTFMISSMMHAQEIIGGFSTARFFYYLMEQPDIHPVFRYIRDHVRVICLPLQNPWGFNQSPKSFANVNNVNVNSNFDSKDDPWIQLVYDAESPIEWNYKGVKPWSEAETKILRDELIKYKDEIEFWIDTHTGTGWNQDVWVYYVDEDNIYKPKLLKAVDWLSQEWAREKGVTVEQLNNRVLDAPTSHKLHYAFGELGIPCITPEYSRQFGGVENGKEDLFAYLRNLVNFIIAGLSAENVDKQQLETLNVKLKKEIEGLEYERNMLVSPNGQKYIIQIDNTGTITTKQHNFIQLTNLDISDSFDRTDNLESLGSTSVGDKLWTNTNGTFGIASNKAKPIALGASGSAPSAAFNVGYSDYEASVDITWDTWAGMIFRYVAIDNTLQVRISSAGLGVSDALGNTYGTYTFTPVKGTVYNVKVRAKGSSIIVYLAGTERINITNTINQTSTRLGLKTANDLVSTFDNLFVTVI